MRDRLDRLSATLTGVLTTQRAPEVVDGREITPPSWWVDDEEATRSSRSAMSQL